MGSATALKFAEQGCHVVVNYSRSAEDAEKTAADAAALGVKAIAVQADVSDDAACRSLVDTAVKELGRLDVLINNAGVTTFVNHADLEKITDDDWDRIMAVNVKGTFNCTRAATPALKASGNGEVVNVTSVAGVAATGSSIPYCASKAAVNNMTIALARVLAPRGPRERGRPGGDPEPLARGRLGRQLRADHAGHRFAGSRCRPPARPRTWPTRSTASWSGSDLVTGQILVCDGGMLIR